MATVELKGIVKHYPGNPEPTVRGIDLAIADKEFMVLVGPSGCGKSTVLRMIAGLEDVSEGELHIGGRRVDRLPPKERNIAMVFQNYALFPHLTVADNIAFGLKVRGVPANERRRQVDRAAGILGLEDLLLRKPGELSGGQRQRVAVGRAIVRQPDVFLFDEPLSNLDAKLRAQMRAEIIALHHDLSTTMVYVTHDQIEAMTMAHRITVFAGGHIQQLGSPRELYDHPASRFVAGFIGSPTMNFVEGRVQRGDPPRFVSAKDGGVTLSLPGVELPEGAQQRVTLGVRPQDLHLEQKPDLVGPLETAVELSEYFGSESAVTCGVGHDRLVVLLKDRDPSPGETMSLFVDPARVHLFVE